ncbi:MAG: DNA pilot protein [Microvirus sp.]|nr:MAG: DNA pilot protein [Microvirus sp.]
MAILDTQTNAAQPGLAAAAIASSSLPIVGDLVNYALNKKQNQKAYEQNLEMWNKQNLYNHPSQQMERLKAAGLNPNLAYGNGTSTLAGAGPDKQPAQANIGTGLDALGKLGQYQNIQLTKAQTDNVQAETANKLTSNSNLELQQAILRKQAEKLGIDIEFLNAVNPDRALKIKQELLTEKEETFGKTLENQKNYVLNPMQIMGEKIRQANMQKDLELKGKDLQLKGQDIKLRGEQITNEKLRQSLSRLDIHGKRTDNEIKKENLFFEKFKNELAKNNVTTADNIAVRGLLFLQEKFNLTDEQMYPNIMELIKLVNDNAGK